MADVLLIGPEDVFSGEMEEYVQGQGHAAHRATGAGQALLTSDKSKKLLAFIDVGSPNYDAQDLLRKILVRHPHASIVATSAEPSVDLAVEFIKEGAWDFLTRPVELEKLALVMDQTLGHAEEATATDDAPDGDWSIVTEDPGFKQLLSIADRTAEGAASVLIQGESGTGKEMLARYIHMKSPRKDKPFVAVNCAALPETLLESELFGHEKGAFTGAISRRLGKFEMANGGTILLDEITEMQIHLQAKLLRVLQEQVVDRVGGQSPVGVDVRIIATSNRAVSDYVDEGNFREDLYYRLNVIPLHIPPLRERQGDIPLLVEYFVKKHNIRNNKSIDKVSKGVYEIFGRLPWRGNVRELENAVERAIVLAVDNELRVEHLLLSEGEGGAAPPVSPGGNGLDSIVGMTVQEMERRLIVTTLTQVSENRTRAAEMLGISIRTLRNKLKEYQGQESSS